MIQAYSGEEQETGTPQENLVVHDIDLEQPVGKVLAFDRVNHTRMVSLGFMIQVIGGYSQNDGQGSETSSTSQEDGITSSTVGLITLSSEISREVTP